MNEDAWERLWAPYDEPTYRLVEEAAAIALGSVVLEIGAGDLRLARRLADKAAKVYAVEWDASLLGAGGPANLEVICADARVWPFPVGVEVAVLLMRHCRHFGLYYDKLVAAGCRYLITNARWHTGVETIDLSCPRLPFEAVALGWYACSCGAVGFLPGPPERVTGALLEIVHEVSSCPECSYGRNRHRLA